MSDDLNRLIESREIPATLRTWAAEIREWGLNALLSPATYEKSFEDMAGKIERDCNRLEYHLKTSVGKAVGHVVLHLDGTAEVESQTRLCQHCLTPLSEHLTVTQLCAANQELQTELRVANERLRYA